MFTSSLQYGQRKSLIVFLSFRFATCSLEHTAAGYLAASVAVPWLPTCTYGTYHMLLHGVHKLCIDAGSYAAVATCAGGKSVAW